MNLDLIATEPQQEFRDRLETLLLEELHTPTIHSEGPIMAIDLEERTVVTNPPRRTIGLIAAAIALLVVGVVALSRRHDSTPAEPTATTTATATAVSFAIDAPDGLGREQLTSADRTFIRKYQAHATVTGDLSGTAEFVYTVDSGDRYPKSGYRASDGRYHAMGVVTYMIDGAIAGCGSGTIMLAEVLDFSDDDGNDGNGGNIWAGTWSVVPMSGTETVQHVVGSGTASGAPQGQDLTGTLSCG